MKTILEKIKACKTPDELMQLQKEIGTVGFNLEENRAFVKVSIRHRIVDFCNQNNISMRKFSILIGYDYSNFINYMKERRDLPYEKVEEILGLLSL